MKIVSAPMPEDPEWINAEWFASYIVWFMNQGNENLNATLIEDKQLPIFYGPNNFGYGLFGN